MKKTNSLITTSPMEAYLQIGKQHFGTGSAEQMSTESGMTKAQVILQQVPIQFRRAGVEYLVLRSEQIQEQMGILRDFPKTDRADGIAPDILTSCSADMKPCSREDVAICLETIASTFQVKVPDDLGLTKYFEFLSKYPKFVIDYCSDAIIREYPYPRLPVPKDFIDRCEPMYLEHYNWLYKITKNFMRLEVWLQGDQKVKNKYLDNVEDK